MIIVKIIRALWLFSFVESALASEEIGKLEEKLQFSYLSQLSFEELLDQKELRSSCLNDLNQKKVTEESQKLGSLFKKEIESGYSTKISIRWISEEVGYGAFSEENIEENAFVSEVVGVVRKGIRDVLNGYSVIYPVLDKEGSYFVIDGKNKGNMTRFINHSSSPNLRFFWAFDDGLYHGILIANQKIRKGDQLSVDYGFIYWKAIGKVPVELAEH